MSARQSLSDMELLYWESILPKRSRDKVMKATRDEFLSLAREHYTTMCNLSRINAKQEILTLIREHKARFPASIQKIIGGNDTSALGNLYCAWTVQHLSLVRTKDPAPESDTTTPTPPTDERRSQAQTQTLQTDTVESPPKSEKQSQSRRRQGPGQYLSPTAHLSPPTPDQARTPHTIETFRPGFHIPDDRSIKVYRRLQDRSARTMNRLVARIYPVQLIGDASQLPMGHQIPPHLISYGKWIEILVSECAFRSEREAVYLANQHGEKVLPQYLIAGTHGLQALLLSSPPETIHVLLATYHG